MNSVKPLNVTEWDSLPLVLTAEHAAKIAGVGVRAIYDMAKTKGFPAVRFGRAIRIPREAFRHWLNTQVS